MRNLRELADSKIRAFPGGDPEAYLRDRIEKDWPTGSKEMELMKLMEKDLHPDLVGSLRQEGQAKLEKCLADLAEKRETPRVVRGFAGRPSDLKFSKIYRFWDLSQDYTMADTDRLTRIDSEDFADPLLVGVLIAAVRGGLIVNCQIDIEPHTHIWREAEGIRAAMAEPLGPTDQKVPVSGRIILR